MTSGYGSPMPEQTQTQQEAPQCQLRLAGCWQVGRPTPWGQAECPACRRQVAVWAEEEEQAQMAEREEGVTAGW